MKFFRQNPALLATVLCIAATLCACTRTYSEISIIPAPTLVELKTDSPFRISGSTKLVAATDEEKAVAGFFADKIAASTGKELQIVESAASNAIIFKIDRMCNIPSEGYALEAGGNAVVVTASDDDGLFYGMQTILQLLPPQTQSDKVVRGLDLTIPAVSVQDAPRFHYRGMHIDPCRNFRDAEWVKKQLDVMAMYKLNKMHFHLTEDQGWRIEIKKYPKLTQFGPYYTQEELRDIVAYAAERHIEVIPELEIPGHEMVAIAAYPWLSCVEDDNYTPRKIWGVEDIVMCPGKESTFEFLEDVIDEMVDIFPCEYFHIGGDECPKVMWEKCPLCQRRIRTEKLYGDESKFSNEDRLQSYVVRRIEKYLNSKGKRIIGWDEILEGDIASSAIIMSWRGLQGGITGAEQGHDVIMTPSSDGMYLDYYQGDKKIEPVGIGGYFPLENVYAYNPIPAEVASLGLEEHILGVQGNTWSEYFYSDSVAEYRIYPRILAVSEIAWSPDGSKDWNDFLRRLDNAHIRLDMHHIYYHIPQPEQPGGSCNTVAFSDSTTVTFTTTRPVKMVYTLDGRDPDARSTEYTKPLRFTDNATLKIRSVLPTGQMSPVRSIAIVKMAPLPAVTPGKKLVQGLAMKVTPGEFFTTEELMAKDRAWTSKPVTRVREISSQAESKRQAGDIDQYAAIAEGYVQIDTTAPYYISSNNSEVWIDGRLVIDNNGEIKRNSRRDNCLVLEAGLHEIKIVYLGQIIGHVPTFWDNAAVALRAEGEAGFRNIPDSAYFRAE